MRVFIVGAALAGVTSAHFHHGKGTTIVTPYTAPSKCVGLPCNVAPTVVSIPEVNPFQATVPLAKPILHEHGLIPVKLPAAVVPVAPATFHASVPVTSPRMGKMVDKTQPTYFCKQPGFVLEGTTCVQSIVQPPDYRCPGGFQNSHDGICERRAAVLQTCPSGYSRRDGGCARLGTGQVITRCPDDARPTADGGCEAEIPHPLTPTCPEGNYESLTGNCVTTVYAEARAYCPEGFDLVDGTCLQEEVFDCNHRVATPDTHGYGHNKVHYLGAHKRQLTHLSNHHHPGSAVAVATAPVPIVAPVPIIQQTRDCNTPCTTGVLTCIQQRVVPCEAPRPAPPPVKTTVRVQKTCTRVTSTALIFACDEGLLQGNRCLLKQTLPPTPVCNARGDAAYCYAVQRAAPIQECLPEYTRECLPGRQCQCVSLETTPFVASCPSGFEQIGDGCVHTAPVRPICPPGFVLEGDQCIRVLREPADCVFSVTYECDHTSKQDCNPPAAQPLPF